MARTPDRAPGASDEEEVIFEDRTADGNPTVTGALRRVGDALMWKPTGTAIDVTVGGSGISEAQHENLDTLTHLLAETSYFELTRVSDKVTEATYWTNSGKTVLVRKTEITRASGKVSVIKITQYDGAGAAIAGQIMTGTVNRSGGKVANIDWAQT